MQIGKRPVSARSSATSSRWRPFRAPNLCAGAGHGDHTALETAPYPVQCRLSGRQLRTGYQLYFPLRNFRELNECAVAGVRCADERITYAFAVLRGIEIAR